MCELEKVDNKRIFFCFHRAIFNHPEQILVVFNFPREIKDVIINTDEIMTASDNSIKVCSFTYLYKRNLHKFVIQKGEREMKKLSKINAAINYDLNVAIHLGVSLSIYYNNRFGFDWFENGSQKNEIKLLLRSARQQQEK